MSSSLPKDDLISSKIKNPLSVKVKICGVTDPHAIEASLNNDVDFLGFVFYEPSPRNISLEQAHQLASAIPDSVKKTALVVDPKNEQLEQILSRFNPDIIQLHGNETIDRTLEIRNNFSNFNFKVMKAKRIASKKDLENSILFEEVSDYILYDTKLNDQNAYGGTGECFDWNILSGHEPKCPMFLAGGLEENNVHQAISKVHPYAVDVSSGVESVRGKKDPEKIKSFLRAVKKA